MIEKIEDKLTLLVENAGSFLCKYRGNRLIELINSLTLSFHRKLNNRNHNFKNNGELRVLRILAATKPQCIFDVGANVGKWSSLVLNLFPACSIHAFEIVPDTFKILQTRFTEKQQVALNNFGLSENGEKVMINLGKSSTSSTRFKLDGFQPHENNYRNTVECDTRRGDHYVGANSINQIDMLKIDTEGMDLRVIKGMGDSLKIVRVIQFEYGIFNIASRDFLRDFYNHLSQYDYVVGKIYPRHVRFLPYHITMDNFYGGNFLAVKRSENELIGLLRGKRTH